MIKSAVRVIILGAVCVVMWAALIEYVFLPTLHMLGGFFRMAAIK